MRIQRRVGVSLIVLGVSLIAMPIAQAQTDQQVSVAEAARRAREQKKASTKPEKVITNDTLEPARATAASAQEGSPVPNGSQLAATTPAAGTSLSGEASTSAPVAQTNEQSGANANSAEGQAGGAQSESATDKTDVGALKQQIAELQKTVDLAKRELALANDNFYSRPDFSSDDAGKAKLDAMQSDLAQKQDELAQLKAKLPAGVTLQEEKPAENPPATPQP